MPVAFQPGHYTNIVVGILFELALLVLLDLAGSSRGLLGGVLIPAPAPVRVGRQQDIISAAAGDFVPFDLDIVTARKPAAQIAGPGGDKYVIGPGAVTGRLIVGVKLDRSHLDLIDILAGETVDIEYIIDIILISVFVVTSVSISPLDLVSVRVFNFIPADSAGCELFIVPSDEMSICRFCQSCFRAGDRQTTYQQNRYQKRSGKAFNRIEHYMTPSLAGF